MPAPSNRARPSSDGFRYCAPVAMITARACRLRPPSIVTPYGFRLQVIDAAPKGDKIIREVQIYPSSGKLVVGLRIAKSIDTEPAAGEWVYLSATPAVDNDKQTVGLSDLAADGTVENDLGAMLGDDKLLGQLREKAAMPLPIRTY